MLACYDALQTRAGAEEQSINYGAKAVALLRMQPQLKDALPKSMLKLQHPQTLLHYAAITASDEELGKMLDALFSEFQNAKNPERARALAQQLITLADYSIQRTGEETHGELLQKLMSGELGTDVVRRIVDRRIGAYIAMALAYQGLGDTKGAVNALLECEKYAGTPPLNGLSDKVKEAYFERGLSLHTLSTGEDQAHVKVRPGELAFWPSELVIFRLSRFGLATEAEPVTGQVKDEPPVEYSDGDFTTVGVTRTMNWKTANDTYIRRVKAESAVFNNPFALSEDTKRVAALTTAWGRIKQFYLQKEREALAAKQS